MAKVAWKVQGQPAQGVRHPVQGRVRRLRARRRRLPRLDARRRPPVHDPARAARGQLRRAVRPRPCSATSPRCAPMTATELRELGRLAHPMRRRRGEPRLHAGSRGTRRSTPSPTAIRTAGGDRTAMFLTSRGITNEVYYVGRQGGPGDGHRQHRLRRAHVPRAVDGRAEADDRRRRQHVLDAGRARDRPHRAVGHERRQQPAGVHEVPVPGQRKRGAKVVVVNPYLEPGPRALLGAEQRSSRRCSAPSCATSTCRSARRATSRSPTRCCKRSSSAMRVDARVHRRAHRGLGRAGRHARPARPRRRCSPQAGITPRAAGRASSTCTPQRRARC